MKKKTQFDKFLALIKKKAKQYEIRISLIKPNQCPRCGHDMTTDLKATENIMKEVKG